MSKTQIELIKCDSGDWEVLKINGRIFAENHRLYNDDWINLLNKLGFTVKEKDISDEDMENENY